MISIIIPNKDCEYFPEALASALEQTYKDTEVIVVLDNCSKEYLERVKPFLGQVALTDKRVKLVFKEDKPSIPSARNRGIKESKGEWIAYLSADDRWKINFLEGTLKEAEKTKKQIIYTDYNRIDGMGNFIRPHPEHHFDNHNDFVIHLFQRCCVNLSAALIHRDVFDKVMFDEEILYGEDYLFYLLAAKHFEFQHIPEFLSEYREHPEQMTKDGKNIDFDIKLREIAKKYWEDENE